jgi:hypothetical protein
VKDKYSNKTDSSENKYDYKNSSSFVNTNKFYQMIYGTGSAEGSICKDTIKFGNNNLNDLNFILVNRSESQENLDGILGLGYYYEDFEKDAIDFSLIDQLKNKNLINKKLFTQLYTEEKKGKMYIGDLPYEIKNDMENYGTCNTIKYRGIRLNPRWECTLSQVFIGDKYNTSIILNIYNNALFDTGTNVIISPSNFLDELSKTYFKDLIQDKLCFLNNDYNFVQIICKENSIVKNLPPLNFIFGDWYLKMNPYDLFYLYPDRSIRFIILSNPLVDEWIIGEPILKKFHIVFDKEDDLIGFYGTTDLFNLKRDYPDSFNTETLLIILIILGILIIMALIISLFIWFFKRRQNSSKYYDPSMYHSFNNVSNYTRQPPARPEDTNLKNNLL